MTAQEIEVLDKIHSGSIRANSLNILKNYAGINQPKNTLAQEIKLGLQVLSPLYAVISMWAE